MRDGVYRAYSPSMGPGKELSRHGALVRATYRGRSIPYEEQPANDYWRRHYEASLVIHAALRDMTLSAAERREWGVRERECARKLEHWERHRNFDAQQAVRDAEAAKRSFRR